MPSVLKTSTMKSEPGRTLEVTSTADAGFRLQGGLLGERDGRGGGEPGAAGCRAFQKTSATDGIFRAQTLRLLIQNTLA